MKALRNSLALVAAVLASTVLLGCNDDAIGPTEVGPVAVKGGGGGGGGGGGKPPSEAGNNLSYPVLWSEGVTKVVPGTPGVDPVLNGAWWYQWGTNGVDPDVTPASCPPDPDNNAYCDDGIDLQYDETLVPGDPPADNPLPLARAYLQKDKNNVWQAGSADSSAAPLNVHWIDWGDNLESVDWYTRSQVRTEVVLFQDLVEPMLEYEMRHTSGWGIDEVHGLAANDLGPMLGDGTRSTVYSHCARLTIQLLLVDRYVPELDYLVWAPGEGWKEPDFYPEGDPRAGEPFDLDLIRPPIFNKPVHEGGDGPGYYSAEINVKGRIIYGYTWSVRQLNDPGLDPSGAGDYRITFSFDQVCGTASLNTFFVNGTTEIMVPLEEEVIAAAAAEEEPGGGAVGVLVPAVFDEFGALVGGNLTYMDVRILERGGGGGGGGGGGPPRR